VTIEVVFARITMTWERWTPKRLYKRTVTDGRGIIYLRVNSEWIRASQLNALAKAR